MKTLVKSALTAIVFVSFSQTILSDVDNLFGDNTTSAYKWSRQQNKWLRKGSLYHHVPNARDYFRYVSQDKSAELFTDGSLASISEILTQESISDSDDETILDLLDGFVFMSMADHGAQIIDEGYIKDYKLEVEDRSLSKDQIQVIEELFEENKGIKIFRSEKKWKATFFVITHRGGIEFWSIHGSTDPVNIHKLDREITHPNGKFDVVEYY